MKQIQLYENFRSEKLSSWTRSLFSLGNYIMISTTNQTIPNDLIPYLIKNLPIYGLSFNVLLQNDRYFIAEFEEGIRPYQIVIRLPTSKYQIKLGQRFDFNVSMLGEAIAFAFYCSRKGNHEYSLFYEVF